MFYSHEVLTSRKYGVATVWLVATLGAKSNLRRINRKQILDVDVEKACQTIIDPVAPMALRLQGNLLLGVSRVYLQQCGYVLSDAQNAHTTMRMLLRTVQDAALDPDVRKARPEQLVLPEDPSYLPEYAHPPPDLLAELDAALVLDITHFGDSQSLTPFGLQQSASSHIEEIGGLILPSSSSSVQGGFRLEGDNGFDIPGGLDEMLNVDDAENVPEPDFTFDEDGDIIELTPRKADARTPRMPASAGVSSDAAASARVRREHEEGHMAAAQIPDDPMDLDLPVYGDDLSEGEAFSQLALPQSSDTLALAESSSTVAAPIRRKLRAARALPFDRTLELRNKDLIDWNANYLQNMKSVADQKIKFRGPWQAKKNAEYFVWGSGIGDIAQQMLGIRGQNPFDMFVGDNLFELITGVSRKKITGSKHDRDSGIDEATLMESRRVRQKTGEPDEELGRGLEDEGFHMPEGDEVELPREAGIALNDEEIFSAMPWNISASVRGSSAIPRSGRVGTKGSIEHSKRGSRLVSASPLFGRGQHSGFQPLEDLGIDDDGSFDGDNFVLPGPSSDFPSQAASPKASVRVRDALPAEGENFLSFVTDAITEKRYRAQADLATMSDPLQAETAINIDNVTFEELLPPQENTKVVACQGLMMVLALGTKGMLDVQQPEHFGDIALKLSEKAKAMQIIEISDGEEAEDEEDDESTIGDFPHVDNFPPQDEAAQQEAGDEEDDLSSLGDFLHIDNFPQGEAEQQEEEQPAEADFDDIDDFVPEVIGHEHEVDEVEPMDDDDGHFQQQFAAGTAAQDDDEHDSLYDD